MQQFFLLICCCQEIDTQILVAIYLRARPRGLSFVACTVHLLQLIFLSMQDYVWLPESSDLESRVRQRHQFP